MTSLYSHDIILVLFQWIIKQDYKKKYCHWRLEPVYHKAKERATNTRTTALERPVVKTTREKVNWFYLHQIFFLGSNVVHTQNDCSARREAP